VRSTQIADDHFGQGHALMGQANAALEQAKATRSIDGLNLAASLAAVAQGHFHAAMAATTMGTQRELLNMAAGQAGAIEAPANPHGEPHGPCVAGCVRTAPHLGGCATDPPSGPAATVTRPYPPAVAP
jgi:hypothetical protein